MSKGRVWNKGKHNGGGFEGRRAQQQLNSPDSANKESLNESNAEDAGNPINSVKRMNRENWVSRPARVTPPARKKDQQQ
ncbi:hypothetical protein [Paenibacillus sp. sgz500958]|uniref:hypothetical protein n=1 Tax=Paenibacillus sp. sgz500958 TaxID=3242475 RepID=UPI0036D43BF9